MALSPATTDGPLRFVGKEGLEMKKEDAPGMKGYRTRNQNGQLRDKRDDTHAGTIEKQYGVDFGVRSDMHLDELLKLKRTNSLNDLITGQ